MMKEEDLFLKRNKNLLDSNAKLETTISNLMFDLAKLICLSMYDFMKVKA